MFEILTLKKKIYIYLCLLRVDLFCNKCIDLFEIAKPLIRYILLKYFLYMVSLY